MLVLVDQNCALNCESEMVSGFVRLDSMYVLCKAGSFFMRDCCNSMSTFNWASSYHLPAPESGLEFTALAMAIAAEAGPAPLALGTVDSLALIAPIKLVKTSLMAFASPRGFEGELKLKT